MENTLQVGESQRGERSGRDSSIGARPQSRVIEIRPSLDVLENGEAIRILADVPGVDAAHAEVQVEMPHLRIACTRAASGDTTLRYAASLTLRRRSARVMSSTGAPAARGSNVRCCYLGGKMSLP